MFSKPAVSAAVGSLLENAHCWTPPESQGVSVSRGGAQGSISSQIAMVLGNAMTLSVHTGNVCCQEVKASGPGDLTPRGLISAPTAPSLLARLLSLLKDNLPLSPK